MSIIEALAEWITGYDGTEIADVDINRLAAESEAFAMYRAPSDRVQPYIDGTEDVTGYYQLLVRQPSMTEDMRLDNAEWLEGLEAWVIAQNRAGNLPEIAGCWSVSVSTGFAVETSNDAETVYSVTLAVNYLR